MNRERSRLQLWIDNVCRAIFLTEDGRPKSAFLVYSFSLALLFIVLNMLSYWFLVDVLERILSERSVVLRNLAEYLVPGVVGAIPPLVLSFAFRKEMRMVPSAYVWIDIIVAAMLLVMLFYVDRTDFATEYGIFLNIIGYPMLVFAVVGTVGSRLIYRRRRKA